MNYAPHSNKKAKRPRSRQPPKRPRVSAHRAHPLHCSQRALSKALSCVDKSCRAHLEATCIRSTSSNTCAPSRRSWKIWFTRRSKRLSEQTLVMTKSGYASAARCPVWSSKQRRSGENKGQLRAISRHFDHVGLVTKSRHDAQDKRKA